jgi:hypothetical protein
LNKSFFKNLYVYLYFNGIIKLCRIIPKLALMNKGSIFVTDEIFADCKFVNFYWNNEELIRMILFDDS